MLAEFDLPKGEVYVWRVRLDHPPISHEHLAGVISTEEHRKANAYRFDRLRRRYIVSHGMLRMILGNYLDLEPADIPFGFEPNGKPQLAGSVANGLSFNMAHAQELMLVAVTDGRAVGVDLEFCRPIPEADQIAARYFSTAEYADYQNLDLDDRVNGFYRCWTRKEAFLKATGSGLSFPLDRFRVSLSPREPARLIDVTGDAQMVGQWYLAELRPASGYIAALAVESRTPRVMCWQWSEGRPTRWEC
jgi:4'-phosphopantetheinyl transferase